MSIENRPEFVAAQIQAKADEAEVIDLDKARKERWLRILEENRALGRASIFGVIGEVEARIITFPLDRV